MMKQIIKILFWASGARISLLDKITEFEKRKFQLIGTSLLISTLVSTISASYAISLISQNALASVLIGLMWGIMVTNLNRVLISLIIDNRKNKQKKVFWFFPVILFSFFIALTIAFPIQLKVFETEINSNIVDKRVEKIEVIKKEFDAKIAIAYKDLKAYENQFNEELIASKSGIFGGGPVANKIRSKISDQKDLIKALENEENKLKDSLLSMKSNFIEKSNSLNDIIRINNTMRFTYYLLLLTFLLIELTPFVVAYTSKTGLYEEFVDKIETTNFDFDNRQDEKLLTLGENTANSFEKFCISSIIDINHNVDNLKGKAREQLRSGLLLSLIGILAYLGYGAFLFIDYFETHKFQNHHIFLFSSLSIIFFFMQFLGGWYLKQYRTTMEYANSLVNNKERYNRYILAKIATSTLPNNEASKLIETKLLFEILSDGKITDPTLINQTDNNNLAKDFFDSINGIKDLINNIGKTDK